MNPFFVVAVLCTIREWSMGYCVKLDVQKHNCKACVGVLVHLDITLLEAGCGIVHTSALGWRV